MQSSSLQLQSQKIDEYRELQSPYEKKLAGITITVLPNVYPGGTDSELLANSISIKKNDSVLDLCTGNGVVAIVAAKKGARDVTGTDINPKAIENAQKNKEMLDARNVMFIEADLFPPNSQLYDVVTINPPYTDKQAPDKTALCFWDKDNKVVKSFFKNLSRYLKPGGAGYITWSNFADQALLESLANMNNYKIEQINSAAGKSGFTYFVYKVTAT